LTTTVTTVNPSTAASTASKPFIVPGLDHESSQQQQAEQLSKESHGRRLGPVTDTGSRASFRSTAYERRSTPQTQALVEAAASAPHYPSSWGFPVVFRKPLQVIR
jgi:hypothetical protein